MILGGAMAKRANVRTRRGSLFPLAVHALDYGERRRHHVRGGGRRRARTPRGKTRGPVRSSEGGIRRRARSIRRRVRGVDAIHAGGARRAGGVEVLFGCGMIGRRRRTPSSSSRSTTQTTNTRPCASLLRRPPRDTARTSSPAWGGHGVHRCARGCHLGGYRRRTGADRRVCGRRHGKPIGGLFGTAVATMGMLSTAAYVLTMDVFGPIADNVSIAEMSEQPESVRDITSARLRRQHHESHHQGLCHRISRARRSSSSARTWTRWRPSREKPSTLWTSLRRFSWADYSAR